MTGTCAHCQFWNRKEQDNGYAPCRLETTYDSVKLPCPVSTAGNFLTRGDFGCNHYGPYITKPRMKLAARGETP